MYFGTLSKLEAASFADLNAISNIGPVVAKSIYEWFQEQRNKKLVKKILKVGVKPKPHKLQAKNYKLIDGIYDELVMTDNQRKGKKTEWQRFK